MNLHKLLLCCVVLVYCAACSSHKMRSDLLQAMRSSVPLGREEQSQVLVQLSEQTSKINTIKSLWRVSIEEGESRSTLRQIIVAERPRRVRMEYLPLRAALALQVLVLRDSDFTFLDVNAKRAYSGAVGSRTLQRLLGIPLQPEQLTALLVGRIDVDALALRGETIGIVRDLEHGRMYLTVGDAREVYRLASTDLSLEQVEFWDPFSEELLMQVDYISYDSVKGIKVQTTIEMQLPLSDLSFLMRRSSLTLNTELKEGVFEVTIPPDYSVESYGG